MRKSAFASLVFFAACVPTQTSDTSALEQMERPAPAAPPALQPPEPPTNQPSALEQAKAMMAPRENPDGSLTMHVVLNVGGTNVPAKYTIDGATRALPEYVAAMDRLVATQASLDATALDSPDRARRLSDHIEALASVRLVLRDAGDRDASVAFAVAILSSLTQLGDTSLLPASTSLVATFPDAGAAYCMRITNPIYDQVMRANAQGSCIVEELGAFLVVEMLADQNRLGDTEFCVSVAEFEEGSGSYQLLQACLNSEGQVR